MPRFVATTFAAGARTAVAGIASTMPVGRAAAVGHGPSQAVDRHRRVGARVPAPDHAADSSALPG